MNFITGLTAQPSQVSTLVLDDGSRVTLTLEYKPQQAGWFYSIEWPGTNGIPFELNGCRLVCGPNILRQFRKLIPFGLGLIATPNDLDPIGQECWTDGTAQLVLLDADDVEQVEEEVYPGLS